MNVEPLSSKVYLDWPLKKLADAGAANTSRVFVVADLTAGGAADFAQPDLPCPGEGGSSEAGAAEGRSDAARTGVIKFASASPVLARSVYLSFGNLDVKVSDNYFDVLPGETAEIAVTSAASLDALKAQLKVISLTDAFAASDRQGATIGQRQGRARSFKRVLELIWRLRPVG